ncbi:MdpB Microcystin-dependent protein [uncultured Caudovirales phage]|uniref:MdpB Microcystin-dependent protein n=1 Tax=uncultured Caudovirales phage TaxID=2100421 RepID=A0A6J5NF06_9CAUD|nr:MdpB Microcystin-dependent protein [uncultured Caudovirales phage]
MNDQQSELLRLITNYFFVDPRSRSLKSLVPFGFTGQGVDWYSDTIPDGWLACDGTVLNRVDYPELFLVIGTTWNIGGESGTQFRLPDRRKVVAVGKDTGTVAYNAVGKSGGSSQITIAGTNMPAHTHTVPVNRSDSEAPNLGLTVAAPFQNRVIIHQAGSSFSTGTAGSGTPIDFAAPYKVINHIIKT